MPNLLALDAALARLTAVDPVSSDKEWVAVPHASGRVLAMPVEATDNIPRFDNSSVDGFAIGSEAEAGSRFDVIGTSSAGTPFTQRLHPGQAIRIATGAELPQGTFAVSMQEDCTASANTVTVNTVVQAAACCRRMGQDVAAGVTILAPNRRLSRPDVSMLTALGLTRVEVRRKLRVGLASTGSELVEPGRPLEAGQIYDSNRPLLKTLLASYPVDIVDLGVLADEADTTRATLLAAAASVDLILTTGGVSVGARDYVRETMQQYGEVVFWRVAMKPGKPVLFGRLGHTPLLGLPGNPVSTFVTFNLFCRPLMYRLMAADCRALLGFPMRSGFSYRKSPSLQEFARVSLVRTATGLEARLFRSQLSNLISSLLESDGLLALPVNVDTVEPGDTFEFIPWTAFDAL